MIAQSASIGHVETPGANPSATVERRQRKSPLRPALQVGAAVLLIAMAMSGCTSRGKIEDQKFVSVELAAQWIVDNECDRNGAQQGYPGWDQESGGIGHIDYMCDNGKKFSIDKYQDNFFRIKQTNK